MYIYIYTYIYFKYVYTHDQSHDDGHVLLEWRSAEVIVHLVCALCVKTGQFMHAFLHTYIAYMHGLSNHIHV